MVCRATIGLETLFPLLLVGPRWMLLGFLAWGVLFHAGNAFLMGLNTFFWSFTATYPALFYVWASLHKVR